MELHDQLASFFLSKRLWDLGFRKESIYLWQSPMSAGDPIWAIVAAKDLPKEETFLEYMPAYTVAELGQMLPSGTVMSGKRGKPPHGKDVSFQTDICPKWGLEDKRYCIYLAGNEHYVADDNEANARAKMLIYLVENKLMEIPT